MVKVFFFNYVGEETLMGEQKTLNHTMNRRVDFCVKELVRNDIIVKLIIIQESKTYLAVLGKY